MMHVELNKQTKKTLLRVKEEDWYMLVLRASNGYILENSVREIAVCEGTEEGDIDAAEKMLNEIIDEFSIGGSRYDKERLRVVRVQGDKYIPPEDKAQLKLDLTSEEDECFVSKQEKKREKKREKRLKEINKKIDGMMDVNVASS